MNNMMFYRKCILAFQLQKDKINKDLSKYYTKEYFERFKYNIHCEWGQVFMAWEEANKRFQKCCDDVEKALETSSK